MLPKTHCHIDSICIILDMSYVFFFIFIIFFNIGYKIDGLKVYTYVHLVSFFSAPFVIFIIHLDFFFSVVICHQALLS